MLFSIIVPIYGVETFLWKCIDSILNQSISDFELILIDDGSKDNCPTICDEYAKTDDRIRVIHQKNQGLVAARNNGLKIARGEYICHVDGDDWVSHNYLETIKAQIDKCDGKPDMVLFGALEVFSDHESPIINNVPEGIYTRKQTLDEIASGLLVEIGDTLHTGTKILPACWNKCYRRKYLLKHYNRDTKITIGEDVAFTYECILFSKKTIICNDLIYFYNNLNESSMTAINKRRGLDKNRSRIIEYLFHRMYGREEVINRQLHAYAALYMIRGAIDIYLNSDNPVFDYKKAIKMSNILGKIDTKHLPKNIKIFVWMIKLNMYHTAMKLVKKKVEGTQGNAGF